MNGDDPLLGSNPQPGTRSHHRPIRLPQGEGSHGPNYLVRRAVVGACAILFMVGAVVIIVNAAGSDGTADSGQGQRSASTDRGDGDSTTTEGDSTTTEGDSTTTEGDSTTTEGDSSSTTDDDADGTSDPEPVGVGGTTSDVTETEPEVTTSEVPVDYPDHYGFQDDTLYVALYGTPGSESLGVLGEREVDGSVAKAKEVASGYGDLATTVIPTFELIASVASFEAGGDGDYSNEISNDKLRPWVDAADENGMSVILDMQAGRARFDQQAEELEELLLEPHVGVALDPEWRVGPNEVPEGGKIGSVAASEVNATIDYLDQLVEENDLPQKMLIVHQFTDDMIQNKAEISGTDNVQVIIHMDGFGPLTLKQGSYARILLNFPEGAVTGWKNFYDEDEPTPTPEQSMDHDPAPVFVSYQ